MPKLIIPNYPFHFFAFGEKVVNGKNRNLVVNLRLKKRKSEKIIQQFSGDSWSHVLLIGRNEPCCTIGKTSTKMHPSRNFGRSN